MAAPDPSWTAPSMTARSSWARRWTRVGARAVHGAPSGRCARRSLVPTTSKEAAARKLAIKTLWFACGRASEPGFLALQGIVWNVLHQTTVIESYQSKPAKTKYVCFFAGVDRHIDWMLDFGDWLTFDRGMTQCQEDERMPLLPELAGPNAGTNISDYSRACSCPARSRLAQEVHGHPRVHR